MKTFKGYVNESIPLNEADTAECTGMEVVIVDAVNNQGKDSDVHKKIYDQLSNNIKVSGTTAIQQANKKENVSEFWKEITKKNKDEPKTDIIIGGEQISVKCGKTAQLCSGVATETEATFMAALEDKKTKVDQDDEVDHLLSQVENMAKRQVTEIGGEKILGEISTLLKIMNSKVNEPMSPAEFQIKGMLNKSVQGAVTAFVKARNKESETEAAAKERANKYAMWYSYGSDTTIGGVEWKKPDDASDSSYEPIKRAVDASDITPKITGEDNKKSLEDAKEELRRIFDQYTREKIEEIRKKLNDPENNLNMANKANHDFTKSLENTFNSNSSLAKAFAYEATTGYKKFGVNSKGYSPNLLYTSTDGTKFAYHEIKDSSDPQIDLISRALKSDVSFKTNSKKLIIDKEKFRTGFQYMYSTVRIHIDNELLAMIEKQMILASFDTMWNNLEHDLLTEGFIKDLVAKGKKALKALQELWARIWEGIKNIWFKFVDKVKDIFKKALELVSKVLTTIRTWIGKSWNNLFVFSGIAAKINIGAKIKNGNVHIDFAKVLRVR